MPPLLRIALPAVLALVRAASPLAAQGAAAGPAAYLERYNEVVRLAPVVGKVADVNHLVIDREAGQLLLERGKLYQLTPVGGRTIGAVFRGEGRFTFAPSLPAERQELARFAGGPTIDDPISEAVLLFTDTTSEQVRALAWGAADIPGDIADHVRDLVNSLKGRSEGTFASDVMEPLLNGGRGLFVARVTRARGEPLLFEIDPAAAEGVRLYKPVSRAIWGAPWAVVTQSPAGPAGAGAAAWAHRDRMRVPSYRLDVNISEAFNSNLGIGAAAVMNVVAREPIGPWLHFTLHPRLDVDSARWAGGEAAPFFKAHEDDDLWVRAARPLAAGDSLTLTVFYHGEIIDRFGNFFFVEPGADWFPGNAAGPRLAVYDLTYHSPRRYPLASLGRRTDSTQTGNVLSTHWAVTEPSPFATFNLGLFDNFHVQYEGAPPLDVLISDDAHTQLRQAYRRRGVVIPEQTHMRENVAVDVSNSLKLYAALYGESPYDHFYVTEIPYNEGVSFPGLIDLSWSTFQYTSVDGFDEFFRAHETAHQWWGNGVRPASYRDFWLAEGLATYSALCYVQAKRQRDEEYNRFLDQYRADIASDQDVGPIWIGYRSASPSVRRGYDVMVYEKGAWVFHMLRWLLVDIRTMRTDRFNETLRDFYQTFRGREATTADFQHVVEQHFGQPLDWFFDQWVKGTAIPTYHVAWNTQSTADGRFIVQFRVTQEHVPAEFQMPVLVAADLGDNRVAHFRLRVNGSQAVYSSPPLPAAPREVLFNDQHAVLADVKMEHW
jgi:aminopeptidase N